jgi:hypothetical protein
MQIREAIKKNPRIMNLLRMLIRENIFMTCSPWQDYVPAVQGGHKKGHEPEDWLNHLKKGWIMANFSCRAYS